MIRSIGRPPWSSSSVGEFLCHNGPQSSIFVTQSLVLPSTCGASYRKQFINPRKVRNFLRLWLNARAQITHGGQVHRLRRAGGRKKHSIGSWVYWMRLSHLLKLIAVAGNVALVTAASLHREDDEGNLTQGLVQRYICISYSRFERTNVRIQWTAYWFIHAVWCKYT